MLVLFCRAGTKWCDMHSAMSAARLALLVFVAREEDA